MATAGVQQKVVAQVDALSQELVDLACGMVNIPSPPGHEREVCEWVAGWLAERDLEGDTQEVEPTRANVVGRLAGTGGGKSLMLNAHMDTTFSGDPEEDVYIVGRPELVLKPQAELAEDRIFGMGACNDKGPFAPCLIAARAIQQSGVKLRGDLWLTGVCGEIGRGQTWPHRGPHTRGKGVGARHLITNGVWPDCFIVAESSEFSVSWGLPGAAYLRIATRGVSAYAPTNFDRESSTPTENKNAIVKMAHLIPRLEEWADAYEAKSIYPIPGGGGEVAPRVTIGAIEGGVSTKPNWRPALCYLYLDVRIPPDRSPLDIQREVEAVVKATGLAEEVKMYLSHQGYISPKGYEVVRDSIHHNHQEVFGTLPKAPSRVDTSMWNDSNVFWQAGIPGVKYGPRRPYGDRFPESVFIQDLVEIAKVYALTALDICGVA